MELKLIINKREICGQIFIYLSSAFYVLRDSKLAFNKMEAILALAVVFAMMSILYNYKLYTYKLKFKIIILLFFFASFIIFLYFKHYDTRMIISFIAIFIGMNMNQFTILKSLFWSKFIFFVLGMATGGIGHINGVAMQIGALILIYIIWKNNNIKVKQLFFLWTIYFLMVMYTKSGSFVICIGMALIMLTFINKLFIKQILHSWITVYIYPLLLLLNIFFALWKGVIYFPEIRQIFPSVIGEYITFIVDKIDMFTSWRITLAAESLFRYGFSFIGGNVKSYSKIDKFGIYFNLDSGMMWLLQGWGIIMTLIFMLLMVIMMKYLIKNKEYYAIIVGTSIALWALNEDILVSVGSNFMFFIFGKILIENFRYKERELIYEYS